jgi:hypothetical protein
MCTADTHSASASAAAEVSTASEMPTTAAEMCAAAAAEVSTATAAMATAAAMTSAAAPSSRVSRARKDGGQDNNGTEFEFWHGTLERAPAGYR